MHFATLPAARERQDPSGHCVADNRTKLTNAEFAARVRGAAHELTEHGVGPGDTVAIMLPNEVELVVCLFAAWALGAAVTPINPSLTDDEVRYQLADSGARLMVGGDGTPTSIRTVSAETLPLDGSPLPDKDFSPAVLALVVYTSGTTGRPKGVLLDHANLTAMAGMAIEATRLSADDHSLLILPLFHVNGIVVSILAPLLAGGRATIAGRFSAKSFFGIVQAVRPTFFSAVPAIYAMLLPRLAEETPDLSSIRFAACGAAPMPGVLLVRAEEALGITILEGYGLSEGTCASTLNPIDGRRKPGSVGIPLPGQHVAVMDDRGRLLPTGFAGEVVVKGPNVMRGYLNRPEETAQTIIDGWLHTGDVGRFDDDGYLVIVDRIKDPIIRGGENIHPSEIEAVLHRHGEVAEAAVVGAADPVLGEVPVAIVELRAGATTTPKELLALCTGVLSKDKVPRQILVMDTLPRNAVGKIDKRVLRTLVGAA
jgi:long-chain acyl-CoA synthetase